LILIGHVLGTDASHLCEAQDGHRLEVRTFNAFQSMQRAAQIDKIDINIASGFRDFTRQLLIWNNKWQGLRPLYSASGKLLDPAKLTPEEKLHAILTWSALPGGSRHHWGTDLDVYDRPRVEQTGQKLQLVPAEYAENGPCFALKQWLDRFAADFGFYRPYQQYTGGVSAEPWHLSFQPVAEQMQNAMSCDALNDYLLRQDIEGKEVVLNQLPSIYHRYILNQGTLTERDNFTR